ncbi:MAG: energy transducer TonB [Bryobacteraceae bacterium]|jgi:TonB family protein
MRLAHFGFLALPLFAEQFPDAATVLEQNAAALKNYHSYQYSADITVEVSVEGKPMKIASTATVVGLNPGRFRIESKSGETPAGTVVADGENTWIYVPLLKQYKKKAGVSGWQDSMQELGLPGMALGSKLAASAKVVRIETLEVDGRAHDCWVVESRVEELALGGSIEMMMRDVVHTVWIDRQLGIDLQTTLSGKVQGGPVAEAVEGRLKITKHSLRFNEDVPESLFTFTPPEGARQTAEFGVAGVEPAPGPSHAPKAAPGEPQAFVPNLTPLQSVEPVAPDSARGKGASGMVELVVTVDPRGLVTKAEALTGPQVLRQAAVAAVRQWRYRPVIRDGHPVYAYTDAMVNFDAESGSKDEPKFDLSEQVSAAERMAGLTAKYPRSPQQALADLEQDCGGASGEERFYALPQMAKAALAAGALDKAAAYASELLGQRERDWNYGNAIHAGNMVLGLVALRNGSVGQAKHYLLEAGKTPGSPTLDSFGPNMALAKELLEKGEREVVLEYFSLCKAFWKMGGQRLEAWAATVRKGGVPDFGANLMY